MNQATAIEVVPNTIAEPFAGGFYAGRILVTGAAYALIVAPKAEGSHKPIAWNKSTKQVDGALSFFDGLANTQAMAAAGSKLAQWALGLSIGGFSDWYLPSRDELELLYRAFKPTTQKNWCYRGDNPSSIPVGYAYSRDVPSQTAAEAFREGGAEVFDAEWYWSSTQYAGDADYAWMQYFDGGDQGDDRKGNVCRARAVRRVLI